MTIKTTKEAKSKISIEKSEKKASKLFKLPTFFQKTINDPMTIERL